jgi:hypothetical protein
VRPQSARRSPGDENTELLQADDPGKTLEVWTYEMPDGKLEQYQVAPIE